MVGLRYLPLKSSVLLAGTLSLVWLVTGCVTSESTRVSPLQTIQKTALQTTVPQPQPRALPAQLYRYDWTSDRISSPASFQLQAFSDAVKPAFFEQAPEQQPRSAQASGGFANEFAKNLPGSDNTEALPNTPAFIGTNTFFLTASKSSVNAFGLNNAGQLLWQLNLHDNNGRFIGTSPALGDVNGINTLYAISNTGRLYAINAATGLVRGFVDITGEEFEYTSPWVIPSSVTGSGDNIYLAGSKEGRFYKYTFNGSFFTQIYNPRVVTGANTGKFKSSPVVTGLGRHIYIGSDEGRLYKLSETTGLSVSNLDLKTLSRSEACQIRAAVAVDQPMDAAIVPCGSYLFKVRLNDATANQLSLASQSPLLELRELSAFKPTRVVGPNTFYRTPIQSVLEKDPPPTEKDFMLGQPFGFKEGDFLRIITRGGLSLYGTVDTIDDEGKVSLREEAIFPLPSPTPPSFLTGGESVSLANYSVRPTPLPSPDATPSPVPTPTAAGADPVAQFKIGSPDGLSEGDLLVFPSLPGSPVATICSSSNPACDKDASGTNRHPGIEIALDEDGEVPSDAAKIVYQINVPDPGGVLAAGVNNKLHTDKFVPFEKVLNRVVGSTNSTIEFELGSVADFNPGQLVRVTHANGSLKGRYEYGVIDSVFPATRRVRLVAPLIDAPATGERVDIVDANSAGYGRVLASRNYSSGNILSAPVLRGNGQHVYLQHGNLIFELNYADDIRFRDEAKYVALQAARLDAANMSLTALSRSIPLVLSNDKLVAVDADPAGKTGVFLNRILLPLDINAERLNDVFPISTPNALGLLSRRSEVRPVLLGGGSNFIIAGGGNGVVYKLHKDMAW
jgi:hypothetical protein